MGFNGNFSWVQSVRRGRKAISFTLKNTNFLQSETFDAAIIAKDEKVNPMRFQQICLSAGKSYRFDFDSVGWDWCQGDIFAILNKRGEITQHWELEIQTYAPGECPECHGNHKCKTCGGQGTYWDNHKNLVTCRTCGGTGVCQTCYVPTREDSLHQENSFFSESPNPNHPAQSDEQKKSRRRQLEDMRRCLSDMEDKVRQARFDYNMRQLKGDSYRLQMSSLQFVHNLERQRDQLRDRIEQLERYDE